MIGWIGKWANSNAVSYPKRHIRVTVGCIPVVEESHILLYVTNTDFQKYFNLCHCRFKRSIPLLQNPQASRHWKEDCSQRILML